MPLTSSTRASQCLTPFVILFSCDKKMEWTFHQALVIDMRNVIRSLLNPCDRINLQRTCKQMVREDPGKLHPTHPSCFELFTNALTYIDGSSPWKWDSVEITIIKTLVTVFVRNNLHLHWPDVVEIWLNGKRNISLYWKVSDKEYRDLRLEFDADPIQAPDRQFGRPIFIHPKSKKMPSSLKYPIKFHYHSRIVKTLLEVRDPSIITIQWTLKEAEQCLENAVRKFRTARKNKHIFENETPIHSPSFIL
jgi:hypothetical protein